MEKHNLFNGLSDFIQTISVGFRLVLSTLYHSILKPVGKGLKRVWEKIWDKLVYLNPHMVFSFFYIAFAILSGYLEFSPPASPIGASIQISSLAIMSNLFHIPKEYIIIMFGLSAWLISNIRRPLIYVMASIPLFLYAYSVVWGVFNGLVIMRGLLAALAYGAVGLFAIVTIRQEIQNAIHLYEIKKLKSKLELLNKEHHGQTD